MVIKNKKGINTAFKNYEVRVLKELKKSLKNSEKILLNEMKKTLIKEKNELKRDILELMYNTIKKR